MPGRLRIVNKLSFTLWRADLRGGAQAAAVALPMGLAFGVASGVGPVAGIYSAVCSGLFAALFGGVPTQISGPTGPIAIVMASVFVQFADQPVAAFMVVVLAGFMQLAFGALHMGRYINLIPYPVTSGFACAVGCIIIVMQFNPLLGQPGVADTLTAARTLPASIAAMNPVTLAVGCACFAACQWMPQRLRQTVPVHFAVLLGGTVLAAAFGVALPRIDPPATLLPTPQFAPLLELPWRDMWLAAFVLALISSLDSLVTAMSADNATQQFHDSDRELRGQGLGNIVSGLLGALPGSGSTFRTMANIRGGGRTPLSGVFHALLLLVLLLSAGNLIRFIPASVLSGILIYIGLGIIDWSYIRKFPRAPRFGVVTMIVVWMLGLFVSVVTAVAVGFVMASLAFVKKMADLQLASVKVSDSGALLSDKEQEILERCAGEALYIGLGGPMTFGAANGLTKRLAVVRKHRAIILDFTDVPHVDESAIIALENVIERAQRNRQAVILIGLQSAVVRAFARFGLLDLIRGCNRFRRRLGALRYAERVCTQQNQDKS
ncbi:MAG TPA: SulP family inorganic anion transporter [Gammaproteobacteria bacterium]|nr:SulP family inorganic anion transporter [Gammaproteobacteria bacterium]